MTRSLGIDIGSSSIKMVEVNFTDKEASVLGLFEIALTPDDDPGEKLKSFFDSNAVNPDRIAIGLGNSPVLVKKVFYPFGDRSKVEQALSAEFEDSIPFELDDYLLEFQKLGRIQKSHVFLAGLCHKSNITQINNYFENSETIPNAYCLDNEILARLALTQNRGDKDTSKTFCVCDIGFQTTKLAIVKEIPETVSKIKDLAPYVFEMRTLGKGALEIYDWMDTQKNMSMADCEQWLVHRAKIKNTPSEGDAKISDETSDDIKTALKPVLVEIYQTLQSLKSKQGITPDYILLTGGLTQLDGFGDFFSKEIRIETRQWDPLSFYQISPSLITTNKRNRFSIALSLAEVFRPSKLPPSFNFRRSTLSDKHILTGALESTFNGKFKRLASSFVATFFIFIIYQLVSGYFINKDFEGIRSELISNFRELDPVLGKRATEFLDDLDRAEEMFSKEKQRQLRNIDPSRPSRSDLLLEFSQSLPTGVKTEKFQIQDGPSSSSIINVDISLPANWNTEDKTKFEKTMTDSLEGKGFKELQKKITGNNFKLSAKWKENS